MVRMLAIAVLSILALLHLPQAEMHPKKDPRDTEPPVNTYCPDDIVKQTRGTEAIVTWKEPTYTDNCGKECPITIIRPAARSGEVYFVGSSVVVQYIAIDPSGNQNTKCVFSVSVVAQFCYNPEPLAQVALALHGTILVPFCKKDHYPVSPWQLNTNFFICDGKHWKNPVTQASLSSLPKCTADRPPKGQTKEMYAQFSYDGDCNDLAGQNNIRQRYAFVAGCFPPCTPNQIKVFCPKSVA